jgi:hypothetical protein
LIVEKADWCNEGVSLMEKNVAAAVAGRTWKNHGNHFQENGEPKTKEDTKTVQFFCKKKY